MLALKTEGPQTSNSRHLPEAQKGKELPKAT